MDPAIFKAYDIRGTTPGQIDEVVARRLGKVLAALYQPRHVLVGRDMRTTSTALETALIDGLCASGVSVTRIGLCSTPVFNAAVGAAQGMFDLGVMITASHNPAQYNGFKLIRGDCLPIGQGSGMELIRARMLSDEPLMESTERGEIVEDEYAITRYVERVARTADLPALPSGAIVIDAGNGMAGMVLPKLSAHLHPLDIYPLYWDLDGTFPHHEANPLKAETLSDLAVEVRKRQAMFGAAFDGDGDRIGFVDETGTPIPGDISTALFAQEILRQTGGGKILYDLRSSWSVPEAIREAGGEPIMCRVGHAHIKKQMREEGALFAGELSMHFYFSDFWNVESTDYALLLLLKILICEGKSLSALWRPLLRYHHSGEMNFEVSDPARVMRQIEEKYVSSASLVSHLDGLRCEFRSSERPDTDWWFSLRASNTEPLLRLNMEGKTQVVLEREKAKLISLIQL